MIRRAVIALLFAASVAGAQDWNTLGALWTEPGAAAAAQYSLSFNGSSQYGYVADNANHDIGTNDFTVSFWLYTTNSSNWAAGLVTKSAYRADGNRWFVIRNNVTGYPLQFYVTFNGNETIYVQAPWVSTGAWHHIAASLVRTNIMTLYVDNVAYNTNRLDGGTGIATNVSKWASQDVNNGHRTLVAAYGSDSGNLPPQSGFYFPGQLDDIAIWHRALSSNEVSDIWNSGNGRRITATGTFPSSGVSMGTGLASVYSFDEGTGATAADPINSVNLTLTNSPTWTTGKQFP